MSEAATNPETWIKNSFGDDERNEQQDWECGVCGEHTWDRYIDISSPYNEGRLRQLFESVKGPCTLIEFTPEGCTVHWGTGKATASSLGGAFAEGYLQEDSPITLSFAQAMGLLSQGRRVAPKDNPQGMSYQLLDVGDEDPDGGIQLCMIWECGTNVVEVLDASDVLCAEWVEVVDD